MFLISISWTNPYTSPPDGFSRCLAEVAVHSLDSIPSDFPSPSLFLGTGYGFFIRHLSDVTKRRSLSPAALAAVRLARLRRRMYARGPLFAEFFVQQEIEKKPDFYSGITDSRILASEQDVLSQEVANFALFSANVGLVFLHPPFPPEVSLQYIVP